MAKTKNTRIERDSMGEVHVPENALYGAQTQRAMDNFQISPLRFQTAFIKALILIKKHAAMTNQQLGRMDKHMGEAIVSACDQILQDNHLDQFDIDVFQTGSGTSTNMNANEIIAHLANQRLSEKAIHPNNHVNLGQSSNDVIPTAIRIACALETEKTLMPSISLLQSALLEKGESVKHIIKTARTHLMDAMPITFGQVFTAYASQFERIIERLVQTMSRICELPQGGTAVGTGVNSHPDFAKTFCTSLTKETGLLFSPSSNCTADQGSLDVPVELSSQLRSLAMSLYKLCNDIRWMNSGPINGLAEVRLKALQPGSSIMPAKVNPVIEEAVAMVCTQVVGSDASIAMAASSSQFELNVMQPLVAYNLLLSIDLLSNGCDHLRAKSITHLEINELNVAKGIAKNPILVTALNSVIGYDLAAEIAKKALESDRPLIDVAVEMTDLSRETLETLLDPKALCGPKL